MNDSNPNANLTSTSAPASFPPFFRRRTLGRASPPIWACYEQIPPPGSDSEDRDDNDRTDTESQSESESEMEHDHGRDRQPPLMDSLHGDVDGDMEMEMQAVEPDARTMKEERMDVDTGDPVGEEHACGSAGEKCDDDDCERQLKKQDKGKQRAVEPGPEPEPLPLEQSPKRRHRKQKHHEVPFVYRPILTIKKSEGFVWNQDLFVPSYIKDRYVASTSPPSSGRTFNTPMTSSIPASEFNDSYEIEVVEIRVQGNELDGIIS